MEDFEDKMGNLDKRIKEYGKKMMYNMEDMVSLMCLKRDLTYTNTKEILEYHINNMKEEMGRLYERMEQFACNYGNLTNDDEKKNLFSSYWIDRISVCTGNNCIGVLESRVTHAQEQSQSRTNPEKGSEKKPHGNFFDGFLLSDSLLLIRTSVYVYTHN